MEYVCSSKFTDIYTCVCQLRLKHQRVSVVFLQPLESTGANVVMLKRKTLCHDPKLT